MVLCLACASASPSTPPPTTTQSPLRGPSVDPAPKDRPNIVLLLTDDLDAQDLKKFPNISRELVAKGTAMENFMVTNSWCCPSRATILRSQYVHSHGIADNVGPTGGFARFHKQGLENSTIGTWMRAEGYRTSMIGKYLNHYPGKAASRTYVPPGWDDWRGTMRGMYEEYNYLINENGKLRQYGTDDGDYLSDQLAKKASEFIRQPKDRPFFLYLAPTAPHQPASYAKRHAKAFANAKVPRTAAFNQKDVKAEPDWLRKVPKLNRRQIRILDDLYRGRLRGMLGVDDMVGTLIKTLRDSGQLDNTYFVFTSDNGLHLGQHRLNYGKTTPFEEDIKVPFVIRGPKVAAGKKITKMASTLDLAPTFADIGGAETPGFVEGRSLKPMLTGDEPSKWRQGVLVEFFNSKGGAGADKAPSPRPPTYAAMRTERYTYVEYVTGERQLYDLQNDPMQLRNIVAKADPKLIKELSTRLQYLRSCRGKVCRTADGGDQDN